jgi:hypothetical protein
MKLIGYAFESGRIDFPEEDNSWAFARIKSNMKESQKDQIRLDPSQAPIELRSAVTNGDVTPVWMESMETVLGTANSIYLQLKDGLLRFRRANHEAGSNRTFITLGTQSEFDAFANENWRNVRYLFAHRRIGAFCFDVTTMFTYKDNFDEKTKRIELTGRLDSADGVPQFTLDSSGANASVEVIDWRGSVKEGEIGRFHAEGSHIEMNVRLVNQPFTLLHENRVEFNNHSFTFSGDKTKKQFERVLRNRKIEIEQRKADQKNPSDS